MKGYICDRCRVTNPGQYDQRDGEYPPKGWTQFTFQVKQIHLCEACGLEMVEWMKRGSR